MWLSWACRKTVRRRTTGAAAICGILTGFLLSIFFNVYAPNLGYVETPFYTVYKTINDKYFDFDIYGE